MTFPNFLKTYYPPVRQAEMKMLLVELKIPESLHDSLQDFFTANDAGNRFDHLSQIVLTCRQMNETLFLCLPHVHPARRIRVVQLLTALINDLFDWTCRNSTINPGVCFRLIRYTSQQACQRYDVPAPDWDTLINADNKRLLKHARESTRLGRHPASPPTRLSWQGRKQLDLFVNDVTRVFGVKAKKMIYLLFDSEPADFKIRLASKHLISFLTLFHELHESGIIRVRGNRGLYVYLHRHILAPPKDAYPRRDFRKLRSEAARNEKLKVAAERIVAPFIVKYGRSGPE